MKASVLRRAELSHHQEALQGVLCPVCESDKISNVMRCWKNYHDEKQFCLSDKEWFAQCETCGTFFRAPLKVYEDFKTYGRDYYNLVNAGETVEEHATWHFQNFQKPNYDALYDYMVATIPAENAKRWLDVGSIGYATTLPDYDFHTIEPDERIVKLGRRLFRGKFPFFRRPKISCATLETYQGNSPFDGILFHNSFYCLPSPMNSLKKAADLLTPGGTLLISISNYWNDAVAVRTDGMISRVEDVLQGETVWVFYNQHSLEFLCAKAGFELTNVSEIASYGKKTMKIYRFRKAEQISMQRDLLELSRESVQKKLEECFLEFDRQTTQSLARINSPEYVVMTTSGLLEEVLSYNSLDKVAGVVIFDSESSSDECPITCLSKEELVKKVVEDERSYKVVILSFRYQDEIHAWMSEKLGGKVQILAPNRKSGMEKLFFQFLGETKPCKGFFLNA